MAVHRSHWVALNHVAALETEGERVICRMVTGLTIPVSRSNRASLRQALAERDEHLAKRAATALASPELDRA
jgi:DNA-binding LytR/AlgR family response regulator